MILEIKVVENATGAIATGDFDTKNDDIDLAVYQWEDGNFSCDCNRSLFFSRFSGTLDRACGDCGDTLFSVEILDKKTGRAVYSELNDE